MITTMFGGSGISLPENLKNIFEQQGLKLSDYGIHFNGMFYGSSANLGNGIVWIVLLCGVALWMPNTQAIANQIKQLNTKPISTQFESNIVVNKPIIVAVCIGGCFGWVMLHLSRVSEFLYFQF